MKAINHCEDIFISLELEDSFFSIFTDNPDPKHYFLTNWAVYKRKKGVYEKEQVELERKKQKELVAFPGWQGEGPCCTKRNISVREVRVSQMDGVAHEGLRFLLAAGNSSFV